MIFELGNCERVVFLSLLRFVHFANCSGRGELACYWADERGRVNASCGEPMRRHDALDVGEYREVRHRLTALSSEYVAEQIITFQSAVNGDGRRWTWVVCDSLCDL